MKTVINLIIVVSLIGCSQIPHKDLLGYWKSNELKTLTSMRSTPGVPEKSKEVWGNNIFGKLVVEYKENTYRSKFELEEDNIEEFYQYYPYKVLEKGTNYYLLESQHQLFDETETKTIYMDGNCYYVLVSKWKFREYFCKIK
jgi:hypothetical protein